MSIWCWDCKNYICEGCCTAGQDTEENNGICIWEDKKEDDKDQEYEI